MTEFAVGSIVSIDGDLHEANLYEVTKIKDDKAKLKLLHPRQDVFWIELDELTLQTITRQEAVAEWSRVHAYSGI